MTAVGIDLGTTFSLVGVPSANGVTICESLTGDRSTPSVVLVHEDGRCTVGEEAKRSAAVYPDRTFDFFKRLMGRDWTLTVDGKQWSPAMLSAEVLRSVAADVERVTGTAPDQAVITVPAYFGESARSATLDAARIAGLDARELIHEPTAAALAFGFGAGPGAAGDTLLVYDLGGGTFDVSIVRVEEDGIRVIATGGDHALGGKDWDDQLMALLAHGFEERHGEDPLLDPVAAALLRERAEEGKRALSRMPQAMVSVGVEGIVDRSVVTREQFESATSGLLARTEELLGDVLMDAGLSWTDVTDTLLVGGSTRMPMCSALVERLAGRPPRTTVDPDLAVVTGASLRAGAERERAPARGRSGLARAPRITDVTAHALGFVVISAAGDRYVNEVMISRNAAIPADAQKVKRLDAGAETFDVYLLQGHQERPVATEPLGRYRFTDVPAGRNPVDVTIAFGYDSNGIVDITAAVNGTRLEGPEHNAADLDLSWTEEDPRDHARRSSIAAVLTIDCSGSMGGRRLEEAKRSCGEFAALLGGLSGAQVGLVSFASGARVEAELTDDAADISRRAGALATWGSTDLAAGLEAAGRLLTGRDVGRRVIVVLTDGVPDDADRALDLGRRCAADGIELVTVGVTGADGAFLARLATADADALLTDEANLAGTFRSIARSLAGGLARRT